MHNSRQNASQKGDNWANPFNYDFSSLSEERCDSDQQQARGVEAG
jgi:hypothetical protein